MALREEFAHQGNRLFKLRSEFPLVVLVLVLLELWLAPPPLMSRRAELVWAALCLLIAALGEAIRMYTVGHVPRGTSARSTRQPRGGELNTAGFYSIVRHPLYVGNFLIWLGLASYVRSWRLDIIVALLFWLFYERVMYAEEDYLRAQFGDAYLKWAEHTPAFIPALHGWKSHDLPFLWRVVLRREHSSIFAIIAMLTLLVFARDFLDGDGYLGSHTGWLVLFAVCFLPFVVAVLLTRKTRVLDVEGR